MDALVSKVKRDLLQAEEVPESEVPTERPEGMNRLLGEAISAGWTEGPRNWLATAETDVETTEMNGSGA